MIRRSGQVIVGLAFWLVFAWLWVDLLADGKASPAALSGSLLRVIVIGVVVLAITLAWVRHNVRIHTRKGPRGGGPVQSPRTHVDRLDRPVAWRLPRGHTDALTTGHLVVTVEDGTKVYTAYDAAMSATG
ncbi:MAG: hypothetical protein M3P48_00590 [Actinomycetota bacterium]|nr:hypothetical protein [Actinomycetota bacterium]